MGVPLVLVVLGSVGSVAPEQTAALDQSMAGAALLSSITPEHKQTVADGTVIFSWLGWMISHIDQINSVLQFVLLIASIFATAVAARYHLRKTRK